MDDGRVNEPSQSAERDYQRVVNGWAMYDWANSGFAVVVLTAIFPVHYRALALDAGAAPQTATAYWAYTTSLSLLLVAAIGPVAGAAADLLGAKKRFLALALWLGVLGTASLALLGAGEYLLASLLFAVANLGFAGGNIFYESLLPQVARPEDLDRVSVRGYALGYLGGGLLLVVNALWLYRPQWFWMADRSVALRACFISVAGWWLVFAMPLFRTVAEPMVRGRPPASRAFADSLARLRQTFRQIRRYRELALFLAAFWLYNDGIGTIIKLAAAYGDEIGVDHNDMLGALILTQFIGFPCSIGFGVLAQYWGAKRAIFFGLAVYSVISVAGFFVRSSWEFYALAIMVGVVQGGTQALSRSLFATMVPKTHSAEFFGFFSTGEKVAGIVGPVIFALVGQLTGSSRWGIVSITLLFAAGALLLRRVDVAEGRRVAALVDAST
ncbi:MAG: MFS transporter [Candidatus Binatia bacterium]